MLEILIATIHIGKDHNHNPPGCPAGFEEDFDGNKREVDEGREVFGNSPQKDAFAGDGISEGRQSTVQWSAIQKKTFSNLLISKHATIPKTEHK